MSEQPVDPMRGGEKYLVHGSRFRLLMRGTRVKTPTSHSAAPLDRTIVAVQVHIKGLI
jgi:hypothetical protein